MRLIICVLATALLAGCGASTPVYEAQRYTVEQFLDTESIRGSAFSPDESKLLFGSDRSGVYNAYAVAVTGGEAVALTESTTDNIFPVSFFPGDERMLYMADKGGNEIYHLYLRELDGAIRELTPGEENRAVFARWAHNDRSFFYQSNQRDPRFMDLYEVDVGTLQAELFFKNEGFNIGPLSRDKRYLALSKPITTSASQLFLYDAKQQQLRGLTPDNENTFYAPVDFSPDSKGLYLITDEGSEFRRLELLDLETGDSEKIYESDWDVSYGFLSHQGTYLLTATNVDARNQLRILNLETNEPLELPDLPDGDITFASFSKSEKKLRFSHNGSRSPSNLFVYDLETEKITKLTDALSAAIDPLDLVEGEVIRYPSYDGLEIPAILLKPHLKPGEKLPAIVEVHGGPGGQSRLGYAGVYQYLVNQGYVILRVNNRGSSGYGKTFYKMDDRKHGDVDLKDCVWAKKYLQSLDYVDPNRIGILGGSYGGYMVLAALAFEPDEFAVGVDLFGISNWLRTLQSTPAWWATFRKALFDELGDPETDQEYLRSISPLFHAEQISKPLIVLQGANDPRVLKVESDEIVEAVKKNGIPVEYVVFDDEGHGFTKKANRIRGYRAIREFLDKHLKAKEL